ncbi:hypothetical protein [Pedobacter sp. UC225_65]|uniref:hypothetical protein n=1 Tax=Pedobacter sp. UC225_65 TaxID=3350173 RepID=UPI00366F3116
MSRSPKRIILAAEGSNYIGKLQEEYLKEIYGRDIEIVTQQQAVRKKLRVKTGNNVFQLSPLKTPTRPLFKEIKTNKRINGRSKF